MINNDNMDKEKKQSKKQKWNDPGDHGTFMMVDKNELNIDLTYQREIRGIGRVNKIARDFSWAKFQVLTVAEREDDFYIVDGGNRWRAAILRDDIEKVPCMIFGIGSIAEEADLFLGNNEERKTVSAFEKHRAGLVKGDHTCIEAEKIITKYGYSFAISAGNYETSAVATVHSLVRKSRATADATINLLSKVANGDTLGNNELKALFYLIEVNRGIRFFEKPLDNMIEAGLDKIRTEIKYNILRRGKGSPKVMAEGMLEILNKGMKEKIIVPSI